MSKQAPPISAIDRCDWKMVWYIALFRQISRTAIGAGGSGGWRSSVLTFRGLSFGKFAEKLLSVRTDLHSGLRCNVLYKQGEGCQIMKLQFVPHTAVGAGHYLQFCATVCHKVSSPLRIADDRPRSTSRGAW